MNALRFHAGELAILIDMKRPELTGALVTVEEVGPFARGHAFGDGWRAAVDCDYAIRMTGRWQPMTCDDLELRKIAPPAEPASLTRETDCAVPA